MNSNYSYLSKYVSKEKQKPESQIETQDYILQHSDEITSNHETLAKLYKLHTIYNQSWVALQKCHIYEIDILLSIAYQLLSDNVNPDFSIVPRKGKMYYCIKCDLSTTLEISKTTLIEQISEKNLKKAFEALFDTLYEVLETPQDNNMWIEYVYLNYIARKNVDIYKLLINLPRFIPTPTEKQPYINSFYNQFIYKLYNHTPMVSFNGYNEMFPFKLDFFIRHLYISIEKQYEEDVITLISLFKKYIKESCINYSTPQSTFYYDIYKNGFMTQNYKLELQNSNCSLKSISDLNQKPFNHVLEPFRPICLCDNFILYTVVNECAPKALYTYLTSMCNNKPTLDTIIKILTMTLMSINIKRKVAIITCNEKNVDSIKMFFKKIITINDNTYKAVIDEGFDAPNLNKPGFIEELRALNFSNAKALFVNNTRKEFSVNNLSGVIEKTKPLLMQTFIFQLDTIDSKFPQKDCIHLDLSKWISPENCTLSDNDALWAKIYLPIYGIHVLFKDRKSTGKFGFPDIFESNKIIFEERDDVIQKMCSNFIKRYFVSSNEAQKRKKKRKVAIQEIKTKNPGYNDEIIIQQLDKSLEPSTFDEDFETYAQLYLDTQCTPNVVEQYKITVKDIKKCLIDKQTFKHCEVSIMYTGKNYFKKMGFQYLSLIEPWEITKQKMIDTHVQPKESDVASNDMEIAIQKLIDVLPSVIDMKPLSQYLPMHVRLVTSDEPN